MTMVSSREETMPWKDGCNSDHCAITPKTLCRLPHAVEARTPDIGSVASRLERYKDLDLPGTGFTLFLLQAQGQRKRARWPVILGVGVVVAIDADAAQRWWQPQLFQVARIDRRPHRLAGREVYGERGFDAFRDRQFLGGFEQPDRRAVDPGRQQLFRVDDNVHIEACFRTCKYAPSYPPDGFETIKAARDWGHYLVTWYNGTHRHSALAYVGVCAHDADRGRRHVGRPL